MITIILTACIAAVAAIGIYVLVVNLVTRNTIRKRCEAAVKEAEAEGEMIKKEKLLQAKEKFIQLKSEHDVRSTNATRNSPRASSGPSRSKRACRDSSGSWRIKSAKTPGSGSRWRARSSTSNTRKRRSTA